MPTAQQLRDSLAAVRRELLDRRTDSGRTDSKRTDFGHWEGRLSSSALSTATAVSALSLMGRHLPQERDSERGATRSRMIQSGLRWIAKQQNADGGFGDTDRSHSNIATTMLVAAALRLNGEPPEYGEMLNRCDDHIREQGGLAGLRARYGKDKTFAVPILTNCALAGMVPWKEVASLPFELACFPQSVFRFLKLPVVSYAIPALVAIGQAKFHHRKPRNPLALAARAAARGKSLRVLTQMQPESGGFLEAAPLTAFVVMSLASIGQADHAVARRGEDFLFASMRDDGAWPIDTNLATWNTTLALNALLGGETSESEGHSAASAELNAATSEETNAVEFKEEETADANILSPQLLDWLLNCQHKVRHPYTGAEPGGWAWTDLSGGVPDVDDTSGALLALAQWQRAIASERDPSSPLGRSAADSTDHCDRINAAALHGVKWLLDVQNRDGGWPTFCRGWGTMPFDRSATDLTAHALRAIRHWRHLDFAGIPPARFDAAITRGFAYLATSQSSDGTWTPLWFGNQDHPDEENPVYGTARVLLVYADFGKRSCEQTLRALNWLSKAQNGDGGWGGDGHSSTVEETALVIEAISRFLVENGESTDRNGDLSRAWRRGSQWLLTAILENRHRQPSPIGFYFAKLWYYEDLYPLVFTAAALRAAWQAVAAVENENSANATALATATV